MASAYNVVNGFDRSKFSMFLVFYQKTKCAFIKIFSSFDSHFRFFKIFLKKHISFFDEIWESLKNLTTLIADEKSIVRALLTSLIQPNKFAI